VNSFSLSVAFGTRSSAERGGVDHGKNDEELRGVVPMWGSTELGLYMPLEE
jgi:hypothetical protein